MSAPKVWNKRDPSVPKDAVYVGRPTKWGNPWLIGARVQIDGEMRHVDRADVIRLFREHCLPDLAEMARHELRGKDLVCWCHPLPCHADVLLEIANA